MGELYRVEPGPISVQEAIAAVSGPDRGAVTVFVGQTRDHHAGRRVLRLEYHAYGAMAEEIMRQIGGEIAERFGTPHVAMLHRIGPVPIGEASVIIAVAAAHRRQAIDGCSHGIERLKAIVPIWKKEFYEGGSAWIEGCDTVT